MKTIKLAIVGYGNLGRGLERGIEECQDMELVAIFTRRDPKTFNNEKMVHLCKLEEYRDHIDVLLLGLGSATDIPEMAPELIRHFHTVDCYDNHHQMLSYFETMDEIAKKTGHVAMVGTGWDPGLFSLQRMMGEAILPRGQSYTFWGRGVSQGHSDAVRRIEGVQQAVQYTLPKEEILSSVKDLDRELPSYETHDREVYVVATAPEEEERIRREILSMPDYFEDYHTTVHFISSQEFERDHRAMPHGGHVIRVGQTDKSHRQVVDFSLELESNPQFTATVAVAAARAVYRLAQEGQYGATTILTTPPHLYHPQPLKELIEGYL